MNTKLQKVLVVAGIIGLAYFFIFRKPDSVVTPVHGNGSGTGNGFYTYKPPLDFTYPASPVSSGGEVEPIYPMGFTPGHLTLSPGAGTPGTVYSIPYSYPGATYYDLSSLNLSL